MSFIGSLRRIVQRENLSSPNGKKWDAAKALVAENLGVAEADVYCTYLGKATQAQVRLGKQIRADVPYQVALAFGGDGKRESSSYSNHARRALSQFPTLQAVVLLFEEGSPGSGLWLPERLFLEEGSNLGPLIESWYPSIVVEEVPAETQPLSSTAPMNLDVEPTLQASDLHHIFGLLKQSKNVLLKGVPGVGKTYVCRSIISNWAAGMGRSLSEYRLLVMHPASSYEDLIEGLRPSFAEGPSSILDGTEFVGDGGFKPTLGRITEFIRTAALDPNNDYLLILDEVNRTNLAAAFGEFLLLVEATKRAQFDSGSWQSPVDGVVTLTYSGRTLFVPENLYIVATMNTSDHSISPMDRAMSRRFESIRLEPMDALEIRNRLTTDSTDAIQVLDDCASIWERINDDILYQHIGPDALVGHASLLTLVRTLNSGANPTEAASYYLESALMAQVIQLLSDLGQESLLIPGSGQTEQASATAALLQTTLNFYGLDLMLLGDGVGRRLTVSPL